MAAHVPFGAIAWRVHALSGAMGALTCVCIAWLVWRRTGNRPRGVPCRRGTRGVPSTSGRRRSSPDVYTTNAAVLFLTLALAQKAAWQRERATWPWTAAAVVYGLGLANHWPLLILGSPILLAPDDCGRTRRPNPAVVSHPDHAADRGPRCTGGWSGVRINHHRSTSLGPIEFLGRAGVVHRTRHIRQRPTSASTPA